MTDWPATEVALRPLASLVPDARNARTHSPEQIAQIMASFLEFGFTIPVLVDEASSIIAGELCDRRVLAMELNPAYVDVAVRRWQNISGEKAVRVSDGAAFDDVAPAGAEGEEDGGAWD